MLGKVSRLLFAGPVLMLLAACGSSGTDQLPNLVIPNAKTAVTGDGALFGVAFVILDQTAFVPASVESVSSMNTGSRFSTQAFTEVSTGRFMGMLSDVDSSGTVTLRLPHPDDIPDAAMAPAADSFWLVNRAPDCSVIVEPSTVQMTVNIFIGSGYPGFGGLMMTSSGETELVTTVASDQALDLDNLPVEYIAYQWIYSDGEAVVSFEGTNCGPFSASQVDFREGWNIVGWSIDSGAGELVNVEEPETIFLNAQASIVATPASNN